MSHLDPVCAPAEAARRLSAKERVLLRLQAGPALNTELNDICFRYGARILEIRAEGHRIDREPLGRGVFRYTLRPQEKLF